jgi:hypothetical protein
MSEYSTSLKLTLIGDGEQTGTWGNTTNTNLGTLLEQAIVGQTTIIMVNADYTLTNLNGASDEARNAVIIVTGNQNATFNVIVPNVPKLYMVTNSLDSSAIAYIKPSGGSVTQIPNGRTMYLYCTGTAFVPLNYVQYAQSLVTGGTITTGAITCSSLTSTGAITSDNRIIGTSINSGSSGAVTLKDATGNPDAVYLQATNNAASTEYASIKFNSNGTITPSGNIVGNLTGTATTATTVSTTVASGATGTTQPYGTINTTIATTAFVQAALSFVYPVGCIYTTTVATNPGSVFGFGTWSTFGANRVMMGAGGAYPAGSTGGSADAIVVSHTHGGGITSAQNIDHSHTFSGNTGVENQGHIHQNAATGGSGVVGPYGGPSPNLEEGAGSPDVSYGDMGLPNAQHIHAFSGSTSGQNQGHYHSIPTEGSTATDANLPPYIVVYMWKRDS